MRSPCVLIFFVLALFITVIYASRLCGLCNPGFYLNGCKNSTTPNCEGCPDDSYKQGLNSRTQCTRCSNCRGRNNIEVQKCNGTHDRKCLCKKGYWYDTGALFCSHCSSCRRGKGVTRNCTLTADTKCNRCIRGVTFSPGNSRNEPCRVCKKCNKNEELIKRCTRRKDTECKPVPVKKEFQLKNKSKWPDKVDEKTTIEPTIVETLLHRTEKDSSTSVSLSARKQRESDRNRSSVLVVILYVVGGVVGLVIVVVIFVIFIVRKRRKKPRNQVSVPSPQPRGKQPINRPISTTPLMHGSADKLLRDVSYSLIDELSRNLNPKGRWKTLAGKLSFSSKDIENFELDPTNATAVMLSHWGQQKHSTLHNLYDVLKNLKWTVEGDILAKYLS